MAEVIPVSQPASDFGTFRVLVVDPHPLSRVELCDILAELGTGWFEACAALNGDWDRLDEGAFNALFLDWSQDCDAVALLGSLRAEDNPLRFLPVVVMTAYAEPDRFAMVRDAGANEFMVRPLAADIVASRLRMLIQSPRLFINAGTFFGPDRRRRRIDFAGPERRKHENWRQADRRRGEAEWAGPERRQGRPGFQSPERRLGPRH